MSGGTHAGATEEVAGGGTLVAVPARMLDECASLGDVLSRRAWAEDLDDADRDTLRAFLPPDVAASDEALGALLDRLFAPGEADEGYFHFGNPASRAWREMRDRERHPDVMRLRAAVAAADRGVTEYERRLHHNRIARAALRMKRFFDATDASATPNERAARWREARQREESPEPPSPEARVAPAKALAALETNDDDPKPPPAAVVAKKNDTARRAELAAREAMEVATAKAEAAAKAAAGEGGGDAVAALGEAEEAMRAAEAARRVAKAVAEGGGDPNEPRKRPREEGEERAR